MEFKKPKSKDVAPVAGAVIAGAGGGFATRAIIDSVTKPAIEAAPTQKELDTKKWAQGGVALASLVALMFVSGNDTAAQVTKGALAGTAIVNGLDFAAAAFKKEGALPANKMGDFVRSGLGLGCGCQTGQTDSGWHQALNQPSYDGYTWEEISAIRDANLDRANTTLLSTGNSDAWKSMPVV
ncbi:hypothetical protein [Flavobacterium sp. CAU 1735]|uniref:hypothetical protein n=1 Tax=Flavobacterium sp. CAU 1735 TaxID=3140361 RepID=UPI00325FEC9B